MLGDKASRQRLHPLDELRALLRGIGQIMLQPSAATGLLFMAGIALGSAAQAAAALSGAVLGYLYGRLVGSRGEWQAEGLFGFNACLVALAVAVIFEPSLPM